MSWLEPLYAVLQAPLLLLIMAAATAVGWYWRRKHLYLLWLVVALLCAAWASHIWMKTSTLVGHSGVLVLCWASACCAVQAVAQRFGRQARWPVILVATLGMGATARYLSLQNANVLIGTCLLTLFLAVVLGHIFPAVWRSAKRHQAEHCLQWIYAVICLAVLLGPWLSLRLSEPLDFNVLLLPAGISLGIAMLLCAWQDSYSGVRTHQYRDPSTGLLNRLGLEAACGQHLSEQAVTVVVMCELDHFGLLQQQLGHHLSQEVLRSFAQLLQACVREGDWVARLGEEEFAMALRNVAVGDAQALVQRIHLVLKQQDWMPKAASGKVTASFSVAHVRDQDTLNQALHRADVLLCQAKEQGANSTVVEGKENSAVAVFL